MDTFTKQGLILAGTILLGLVLLLVLGSGDQTVKEEKLARGEISSSVADTTAVSSPTEKTVDPKKWFAAPTGVGIPSSIDLSELGSAPKELEAVAVKYPVFEGTISIPVRISSSPRCMFGDLDLMLNDYLKDQSATFLITLEELEGSGPLPAGQRREFVPTAFRGATRFTMQVPVSQQPRHFGLFMCRDKAGSGRCNEKRVEDLSALSEQQLLGKAPVDDRIYYFQYLLLDNNTITLLESDIPDSAYNGMENYLVERVQNRTAAAVGTSRARALNAKIKSASPTVNRLQLEVDLPRDDKGYCKAQGKGPISITEIKKILGK